MRINISGFYFDEKYGDKKYLKELIKEQKITLEKLKKLNKKLKPYGWTLNEYIQFIFPNIYQYTKKTTPKTIQILKDYGITIKKSLNHSLSSYNIPLTPKKIKLSGRKISVGDDVLIYLRDLNGIVYIKSDGSFVHTIGKVVDIFSKKRIRVQDSFNNYYVLPINEVAPVMIDVHGHLYYDNLLRKANSYIMGAGPGSGSIVPGIGLMAGDMVMIKLRTRDGRIILDNGYPVQCVATITNIYSKNNITVIDSIGNIHKNISYTEMSPPDFTLSITQHALYIYSITP